MQSQRLPKGKAIFKPKQRNAMETQELSKKKRGAPKKDFHPAKLYSRYIDSLPYSERSLLLAKIAVELGVGTGVIARFRTLNSHHTKPHRDIINRLAGCDVYANNNNG